MVCFQKSNEGKKNLKIQRYKNRKTQNFGQSAISYEDREFVTYQDGELTIEGIKDACERHFAMEELSCDILASDQGPSSTSVEHIPDRRVFHVRFVNETSKFKKRNSHQPIHVSSVLSTLVSDHDALHI